MLKNWKIWHVATDTKLARLIFRYCVKLQTTKRKHLWEYSWSLYTLMKLLKFGSTNILLWSTSIIKEKMCGQHHICPQLCQWLSGHIISQVSSHWVDDLLNKRHIQWPIKKSISDMPMRLMEIAKMDKLAGNIYQRNSMFMPANGMELLL